MSGVTEPGLRMLDAIDRTRKLARVLESRIMDRSTRERLRTLIDWEGEKRISLFGLVYGDAHEMPVETLKLTWHNTSGCWLPGDPLVIFQEHRYVFPSEGLFAQVALALEAGVGQDG